MTATFPLPPKNSTFNGSQTATNGGGLALKGKYSALIDSSNFTNNETYSFGGGALKIENEGIVSISNCSFQIIK